jgi:hypothetical protein
LTGRREPAASERFLEGDLISGNGSTSAQAVAMLSQTRPDDWSPTRDSSGERVVNSRVIGAAMLPMRRNFYRSGGGRGSLGFDRFPA